MKRTAARYPHADLLPCRTCPVGTIGCLHGRSVFCRSFLTLDVLSLHWCHAGMLSLCHRHAGEISGDIVAVSSLWLPTGSHQLCQIHKCLWETLKRHLNLERFSIKERKKGHLTCFVCGCLITSLINFS